MNPNNTPPTEAELHKAYLKAGLKRLGIPFKRALETRHLCLALTECVYAERPKAPGAAGESGAPTPQAMYGGNPPPRPARQGCYLSMQFQLQEDQ